MARINRSNTTYVKLPEELATKSMPDAKASISLNLLVPKGMEKAATKFMEETQKAVGKAFKKFMRKQIEKGEEDD